MNVQVEAVSSVRRRMRYAVPALQVGSAFTAVIAKINAKARLPGFRPGKAPGAMIERMYGTEVRRQVLDKLLADTVFTAIEKADLRAVGRPEVEELSDLARDRELQVTVQVEVLPDLELSGYEGAALTAKTVVADAEDVTDALEQKARERGEWATVETGAGPGDEVELDFSASGDGAEAPLSGQKRRIVLGDGQLHKLIDAAIVGVKAGEQVDKRVIASAEDAPFSEGAEVAITAAVHEVRHLAIPAVDDEFAKDLGEADLPALTAKVQAEVQAEAERRTRELKRGAAVEHLVTVNTIEVPSSVIDGYVDEQLRRSFGNLDQRMMQVLGGYIQQMRGRMAKDAEQALRRSLALEAIAKSQAIEVSDDEVAAELDKLIAESPGRAAGLRRQYSQPEAREELRRRVQHEKSMDYLVSVAQFSSSETVSVRAAREDNAKRRAAQMAGEVEEAEHDAEHCDDPTHNHG